MMPNGWLINLQFYVVIFAKVYLSGLFRNVTVDCSTVEATLTLAKEIRDQGRYCMWKTYNESILNFKERDVPIALIFIIDHNLTPIKLKLVLDIYHAIACLLPNDSNHLFAAVLHLPKNPKLYFGKLVDIRKLHRSFENAGEATKDDGNIGNNSCHLMRQTINIISKWLTKTFFFEKIIKHIIFIDEYTNQCIISKHFRGIYRQSLKSHRWLINKIVLNVTKMMHSQYQLERSYNVAEQFKNNMSRNIFEGTRLLFSNSINQSKNVMQQSLTEFLNEILFESIIADAIFSTNLTYNWIKYDFEDFKRHSQQSATLESWTWLLNFLRVTFFFIGAFIILITTCALCGFACMLSSVIRDDYYRRQQMREREEELRILEEHFREGGINIHFNVFDHQSDVERESNNETNTAVEQISKVDFTQDTTIISCTALSLSVTQDHTTIQNDEESETEKIIDTERR